jgi:hypothetical protein
MSFINSLKNYINSISISYKISMKYLNVIFVFSVASLLLSCKKQDANFCWSQISSNSDMAIKQVIYDHQLNDFQAAKKSQGSQVECFEISNREAKKYLKSNKIEYKKL